MSQITICTAASRVIQPNVTVIGTSSAAGLIEIQTSTAHGLLTNDIVNVEGVGGTIEANGQRVITKIDATHFTLNGSIFTNAFTSGGQVFHLGWVAGQIAVDNTVFAAAPDFTLTARLESLSSGNIRLLFEDAVDAGFATAQPLLTVQSGPGAGSEDGEKILCAKKRDEVCDARFGVAGAVLRLKVFVSGGAFSSAQLSAWLTY